MSSKPKPKPEPNFKVGDMVIISDGRVINWLNIKDNSPRKIMLVNYNPILNYDYFVRGIEVFLPESALKKVNIDCKYMK